MATEVEIKKIVLVDNEDIGMDVVVPLPRSIYLDKDKINDDDMTESERYNYIIKKIVEAWTEDVRNK